MLPEPAFLLGEATRDAAHHKAIGERAAADVVVVVEPASAFSGSIEPRYHTTIRFQHSSAGTDR